MIPFLPGASDLDNRAEQRGWHQCPRISLRGSFPISNLFISIALVFASGEELRAESDQVSPTDRAAIRETLKQLWDSMATFEFTTDEFTSRNDGEPAEGRYLIRTHFIKGLDGRSATKQSSIAPDGREQVFYEVRSDGVHSYRIGRLKGHDIISDAVTYNMEGNELEYKGPMCYLLWILVPGGNPLYTHMGEGGTLDSQTAEGRVASVLHFTHRGLSVDCFLDREHDWLPNRVELGGEHRQVIAVTRFSRRDGRWLPAEGIYEGSGGERRGFRVTSFLINHTIHPASFQLPPLPDGANVFDATKGKGYFKGGPEARERLLKAYPAPQSVGSPSVRGSALTDGLFNLLPGWTSLIFWTSLMCIGLSLGLRIRSYFRPVPGRDCI